MKKIIFVILFLLCVGVVSAVDFTPSGNINGRNLYDIFNFKNIYNVTNITATRFIGSLTGNATYASTSNYSTYSGNATYATTAGTALNYTETDPVFVANRSSIWSAINQKLENGSDATLNNVYINELQFNTSVTPSLSEGECAWDSGNDAISCGYPLGTTLQVGQELYWITTNLDNVTLEEGTAVSVQGVSGNREGIKRTDITSHNSSHNFIGLVTSANCTVNEKCAVTVYGKVRNLNTNNLTEGVDLYVGLTPGSITNIIPDEPNHVVKVGIVTVKNINNGIVSVNPLVFPALSELSDVDGVALTTDGQVLVWNQTSGTWSASININNYLLITDQRYNDTTAIDLKLNITDQRYNDTALINSKIYWTNRTPNSEIDGSVYALMMTNPPNQELPHFIVQSGGSTQASVILRSFMIQNEINNFSNTTDVTDCGKYMSYINETLKIDCNTTTTGADLLVSDDIQIVGDAWVRDDTGEYHFLSNDLSHSDELMTNTILDNSYGSVFVNATGAYFNLRTVTGKNGELNLDGTIINPGLNNISVKLLNGTNSTPVNNYLYLYNNSGTIELATAQSYPTMTHVDIAWFKVGEVTTSSANIYAYSQVRYQTPDFIEKVIERFEKSGTLYVSGFDTSSSVSQLNISTGEIINIITEMNSNNNFSVADGFYFINGSGSFVQANTLSALNQYSNGVACTGTCRINVVFGVIPSNAMNGSDSTSFRLVAVLPTDPGAGNRYTTVTTAIQDNFGETTYYPNDEILKNSFTPIARVIVRPGTNVLEPFTAGLYHKFIAGTVTTGGSAPISTTTDHALLTNLDYSTAGHTGFASSTVLDSVNATATAALPATDQRYNDTAAISAVNNSLSSYAKLSANNTFTGDNNYFTGTLWLNNVNATIINSTSINVSSYVYAGGIIYENGVTLNSKYNYSVAINSINTTAVNAAAVATSAGSNATTAINYAIAANSTANLANTTANNALPKAGGTMTGNITVGAEIGFYYNATNYITFNGTCWKTRAQNTYSYVCP